MSKRKQRRFDNEADLLRAIHYQLNLKRDLAAKMELMEKKVTEYYAQNSYDLHSQAQAMQREIDHIQKVLIRKRDAKLEKLKAALAEFRTEILPGMGYDRGVVLKPIK